MTLLAAVLACVVSLAGCSDSSSSPEASPTPTQTFAGPAMSSGAQGESRDAAESFVRYWVETLNYATDSGDTEGLKSLATKDCENCADFAQTLDEIYGKGGRVESKGWSLESAVPMADQPENQPAFQVKLKLQPQKVFATKDSEPETYPGGDQPARVVLIREDDHWLVEQLDI